jgi:hypothetical protein
LKAFRAAAPPLCPKSNGHALLLGMYGRPLYILYGFAAPARAFPSVVGDGIFFAPLYGVFRKSGEPKNFHDGIAGIRKNANIPTPLFLMRLSKRTAAFGFCSSRECCLQ